MILHNKSQIKSLLKVSKSYNAQWEGVANVLVKNKFQGLGISCPKCGRRGMLLSKWIKGSPVKPLFVCHSNGKDNFQACPTSKEQAAFLRSSISFPTIDLIKALKLGDPYVLFSGGQDSLCLLHYIHSLAKSLNKQVRAIHADTTAGFREIEQYVQDVCDKLDISLITVRPPHDYFDLAKRWGIPGVKSRWCCKTLKVAPIRRYLSQISRDVVVLDGIRATESNLRSTYIPIWYHPTFRRICVSPLFYWSDDQIQEYIGANSLPLSPAVKLNTSAECWCGAYKSRKDFNDLLAIHPEIFDKLVEVEEAQQGKYTFLYEGGKRILLSSLKKKPNNICNALNS